MRPLEIARGVAAVLMGCRGSVDADAISSSAAPLPACSDGLALSGAPITADCFSGTFAGVPGAILPGEYRLVALTIAKPECSQFAGVALRAALQVRTATNWQLTFERSMGKIAGGVQGFTVTSHTASVDLVQYCSSGQGLLADGSYEIGPDPDTKELALIQGRTVLFGFGFVK